MAPPLSVAVLFLKTQLSIVVFLQSPPTYIAPPLLAEPFANVIFSKHTLLVARSIVNIPDSPSPSKTVPSLPMMVTGLLIVIAFPPSLV